jgi:GTP pyrophosphokinase
VKVNLELVPLRTELRNGDRVEIITATSAHPNPAWLSYVVTSRARAEIRHALKTMHFDESSKLGERLLSQSLAALNIKLQDIDDAHWDKLFRETGLKSRHDVYADIGLGRSLNFVIARQLAKVGDSDSRDFHPKSTVTILGTEGMAVQFAKCCRPIPGDPILGVIKSGQGLIVHTHDCINLRKSRGGNSEEWLDVAWDKNINKLFEVSIKLIVANQRGVLAKVATAISETESNIENVHFSSEGEYTALFFTLQVSNRVHLAKVLRNLRVIPEVIRISRIKNNST